MKRTIVRSALNSDSALSVPGSVQLAVSTERLHQRVDADAARDQRASLQRAARQRPALQAGHRQEGPRGAQQDVTRHRTNRSDSEICPHNPSVYKLI